MKRSKPQPKHPAALSRWYILLIVAVVGIAAWPLFGSRFIPTHDGEYHIIRFMEFFRMLREGYLFPRWAPTLNSGYGLPLFDFQYPFPNYVGSLFMTFGLSAVRSFQLSLAAAFVSAVLLSYIWLMKLFGHRAALFGSLAGALVPYWFVDIYVRGSVGEVWAFVWVFAALAAHEHRKPVIAAIATALLILSHNIMAMLFVPFLLLYVFLRERRMAWWVVSGIALSAYFWLPAILEKRYVTGLNPVNFRDHFAALYELLIPSWGTGFSAATDLGNKISFQVGILPLIILGTGIWYAVRDKKGSRRQAAIVFLVAWLISLALMLPVSLPVWEILFPMQFIQYPWRLLSVGIVVVPFIAGYMATRARLKLLPWILLVIGSVLVYPYARPVTYEPRDDAYYQSRRNFTDGTNSLGNIFTTIWTPWISKRADGPIELKTRGTATVLVNKYLYRSYRVESPQPNTVTLAVLYFPGWTAEVNDQPVPIDYTSGIIRFGVPRGTSDITLEYTGTPVQKTGETVSVLTLVILSVQAILPIYARRHRHHTA